MLIMMIGMIMMMMMIVTIWMDGGLYLKKMSNYSTLKRNGRSCIEATNEQGSVLVFINTKLT